MPLRYHITDNGPKKCTANLRDCMYGERTHYDNMGAAQMTYEAEMMDSNPFDGMKEHPRITEANKLLSFRSNPGLSVEEISGVIEAMEKDRFDVVGIFDRTDAADYEMLDDDRKQAQELLAKYDQQVSELAEKHEEEYTNLQKVRKQLKAFNELARLDRSFDYDQLIPLYDKILEREEYKIYLNKALEAVKDNQSILVAAVSEDELRRAVANGDLPVFDDEELRGADGKLYGRRVGDFTSGSLEWLQARQQAIGGSDAGAVIGSKYIAAKPAIPDGNGGYVYLEDQEEYEEAKPADYRSTTPAELMVDKLTDPNTLESQLPDAKHERFTQATGRGNSWETAILLRQMKDHPGEIAFCKTSYESADAPELRYNFDGLMLDKETGQPNGVVEIKTASHADHWGNPADGLDGVPGNYRAQVLHYAVNAGFDRGRVAVLINGSDYREYDFNFNDSPELRKEAETTRAAAISTMQKINEYKAQGLTSAPSNRARPAGFSKGTISGSDKKGRARVIETAALYRGISKKEVEDELYSKVESNGYVAEEDIRALFTKVGPNDAPPKLYAVDLETSGFTPDRGRIIEVGGMDVEGLSKKKDHDSLYGVGKYARQHADGVGNETVQNIHHITTDMVKDKKPFKPSAKLAKKLTTPGTVLLSHNAGFEKTWLSATVPGFNNAIRRGEVKVIDSRYLGQWLDGSEKNTMNDYGHRHGVYSTPDGEETHRAYQDTEDMVTAYLAQRRKLRQDEF